MRCATAVVLRVAVPPTDPKLTHWFSEQVQPHEPVLRAWLLQRYGSRIDIDDIVQESFVRVLRACTTAEVRAPKAFLFATARNLALDQMRRHEFSRTEPLVESDVLHVLDEQDVPEEVARHQELSHLTEAIQSLPERCRQIFTLRKIYGLSQAEIAAQLGISEHTVSVQLTRGLHKCTAYFAEHRREREGRV